MTKAPFNVLGYRSEVGKDNFHFLCDALVADITNVCTRLTKKLEKSNIVPLQKNFEIHCGPSWWLHQSINLDRYEQDIKSRSNKY